MFTLNQTQAGSQGELHGQSGVWLALVMWVSFLSLPHAWCRCPA